MTSSGAELAPGEVPADRSTAAGRVPLPAEVGATAEPYSGVKVGPTGLHRGAQVRLIAPRRWTHYRMTPDHQRPIWLIQCPYCLMLTVPDKHYRTADEHLYRVHANNRRDAAGQFDLLPLVTELQREIALLKEDLAQVSPDTGTIERAHRQPPPGRGDRRRHLWRQWR